MVIVPVSDHMTWHDMIVMRHEWIFFRDRQKKIRLSDCPSQLAKQKRAFVGYL